ncbi:hypothetical protein ACFV5N_26495 [Streptomyces sp. NPDC059853]|uniref:hypothetical protein n=1 Tax=Streptomyces sp. NPDC059853 TaxID=3346973 RepID=UPI00365FF583
MTPPAPVPAPVPPPVPPVESAADAINRTIRAFVSSRGNRWSAEDRHHLAQLYDAWAACAPAPTATRRAGR